MKSKPECLICSLKQALTATNKITTDPETQHRIINRAMEHLLNQDLNISPAELGSDLFFLVCRELNNPDPYRTERDYYNQKALSLYPKLQEILGRSEDRIYTALLMAVAGNIIDLGIIEHINVEETVAGVLKDGLGYNDYGDFRQDLAGAASLLYILDNAGEIVFDRILLEEIKRVYPGLTVKIAVKKEPVVNDALVADALQVGLDKLGEIIDTGCGYMGVPKSRCHPSFWQAFREADMVVAKGHANYETLEEKHKALYVILRAKCPIVAGDLGVRVHDSVLKKIKGPF